MRVRITFIKNYKFCISDPWLHRLLSPTHVRCTLGTRKKACGRTHTNNQDCMHSIPFRKGDLSPNNKGTISPPVDFTLLSSFPRFDKHIVEIFPPTKYSLCVSPYCVESREKTQLFKTLPTLWMNSNSSTLEDTLVYRIKNAKEDMLRNNSFFYMF
jgi:hypothetical protein